MAQDLMPGLGAAQDHVPSCGQFEDGTRSCARPSRSRIPRTSLAGQGSPLGAPNSQCLGLRCDNITLPTPQVRADCRELPDRPPAVPLPHRRRPERAQPRLLHRAPREHLHRAVGNCLGHFMTLSFRLRECINLMLCHIQSASSSQFTGYVKSLHGSSGGGPILQLLCS